MSIKEIFFSITEYKPLKFDFSDFYFEFFSEETNFHDSIDFLDNKIISDKTEIKGDLKYFVKVIKENELIGITNLIIKKEQLSKKLKNINFNNLKITISDFMNKKLFENSNIPINKREISISIKIKINYINKKLNFKKHFKKLKKNPTTHNRAISAIKIRETKVKFPLNNKTLSNKSQSSHSSNHSKKLNLHKTTSFINKSKITNFSFDSDSSEESIIDSVLIDNEYTKEEEEENFEIKSNFNFTNYDYPSDNELMGRIKSFMDKYYNLLIEKNNYLNRVVHKKNKLENAYFNYLNKLNIVLKKKEKIHEFKIKKKIKVELNKKNFWKNKIFDNFVKGKEFEFQVVDKIFGDYKKKENEKEKIEKVINLLLKTIQSNLDLDINLNDIFNNEGIRQFRILCQKFGLIENLFPNQIKEDPNE